MINNKIWVEKGFQTSVNVAYDLNNENKVKNFIPTTSSIQVIEDIVLSTSNAGRGRARMLIGAYGRGKSHIILMLISLLYKKDLSLFNTLLEKVEIYNPKLHSYLVDYINSEDKLLPIIVTGSSTSITQSFLYALQSSLKNNGLLDLMPDTNFQAAINAIELWKNEYPDTYRQFAKELNVTTDEFIILLNQYDIDAYENFEKLYTKLTSGSTFNPFLGFDVVELYEKVVDKLKEKGFKGVYIVYDEFSKYLESSMANTTFSDIKLLQDFAEKCERSGDKQMHLMLISHKDIANYIDKNLDKDKVDGWKGVSGRFKHIYLHNNFSQMYEIISAVIKKEPSFWEDFLGDNEEKFEELITRFKHNGIYDKNDDVTAQLAVKGCYPLHPTSTFMLPRLSEKVAQNERTLFTFLSADSRDTLSMFLENYDGSFTLLTPDLIYDYFEPLFKKEHYTSQIHKIYEVTSKALKKLDNNTLASKILKTISLIYIIEQFEKLAPVKDILVDTFINTVSDISEIDEALTHLIETDCIIYLKRSNGYLKIKESSGIDIRTEINNIIDKTKYATYTKDVLNNASFENYIYPTSYNDDMEIIRYFNLTFIDSIEFLEVTDWQKKIEDIQATGVIYAIIPSNQTELDTIRKKLLSNECSNERIMFILPKQFFEIETLALEYNAVKVLRESVSDDEMLLEECNLYYEDLEEVILTYIQGYTRPEMLMAEYYWNGELQMFRRKAQISNKLSEICTTVYPLTPIINNESLNKDFLPTTAINKRNKLVSGLLEDDLSINLGLSGSSQEVAFMRSTLIQTGILVDIQDNPTINLTPDNERMSGMLIEIQNFFNQATDTKGTSFENLYNTLTKPEYGYGIKKGVIPIYIAVVLHKIKKYVVIKNKDGELKLTEELLNSINENPKSFFVFMENWNDDKATYISNLETLFTEYIIEKEKKYGTFNYIVSAMIRWYISLPKYVKEMKEVYKGRNQGFDKISQNHIKFATSLKNYNGNSRDYIFDKILKVYGYENFSIDIINEIKSSKNMFDHAKNGLIKHLASDVKSIFEVVDVEGATLSSVVKDFTEQLKPTTLNYLFPNDAHKVLQLMSNIGNDEKQFIERLGKIVTNLRIDDWTSQTVKDFVDSLELIKKSILEYDRVVSKQDDTKHNSTGYTISFITEDGISTTRSFEKITYSKRGNLLYNEIANALEEMGQSITEQEKRQILMEFIENMCGGVQ